MTGRTSRGAATSDDRPAGGQWPPEVTLTHAAIVGAVLLIIGGRGDLWVLAVLVGIVARSAAPAGVVLAAGLSTLAVHGTAGLGDLAGVHAVLGPLPGGVPAAVPVIICALALVLAGRDLWTAALLGALAAVVIGAPSAAAGAVPLLFRCSLLTVGAALGVLVASRKRHRITSAVALVLAALAVVSTLGM